MKNIFLSTVLTILIPLSSSALQVSSEAQSAKIGSCKKFVGELLSRRVGNEQYLIASAFDGNLIKGVMQTKSELSQPVQLDNFHARVAKFVTVTMESYNGFKTDYTLPLYKEDASCKDEAVPAPASSNKFECPTNSDDTEKLIEKASDCSAGSLIAAKCSRGTGMDVSIAGKAEDKCLKELGVLSVKEKAGIDKNKKKCEKKAIACGGGSMCASEQSYCNLNSVFEVYNKRKK